jgi:hypothetical protein
VRVQPRPVESYADSHTDEIAKNEPSKRFHVASQAGRVENNEQASDAALERLWGTATRKS